jgi:uncharacterized SAM-binding protein YcdF (DUF218 family)
MIFLFKKMVSPFLLPLPFGLLLSFLGLLLLWFTKRQRTGKTLVTVGLCTLGLLSYEPISDALLAPLIYKYGPYEAGSRTRDLSLEKIDKVRYVVVLGGGHGADSQIPLTSHLSDPGLKRLLEGIRIYRENPGSKLLLSGGRGYRAIPEARVAQDVAIFLGVDKDDIILEPDSMDTKDQARLLKPMIGKDPFVLVTSALHLPRAMALFRKQGMDPIPGPAEIPSREKGELAPRRFFPQPEALDKSSQAIHEYVGLVWARLRGQI